METHQKIFVICAALIVIGILIFVIGWILRKSALGQAEAAIQGNALFTSPERPTARNKPLKSLPSDPPPMTALISDLQKTVEENRAILSDFRQVREWAIEDGVKLPSMR